MQPKKGSKLLLHTCCAPCTTYVHSELKEAGFKVTGHFYNPNIHPFQEFETRLKMMKLYVAHSGLDVIYDDTYEPEDHLHLTLGKAQKERCLACYKLRLYQTAALARQKGFDYFSTTLLISPYQDHEAIIKAGMEMSRLHGVPFFYDDFRKGFHTSKQLAKEMNLYRQKYCGCIFSEKERFATKKKNSYTSI